MPRRSRSRPGAALIIALTATLLAAPASSRPALAEDDCSPHCGGVHASQAIEIPGGQYLCFGMPCVGGLCCTIIILPT